jgi:hypothetical protein
VLWRDGVHEHDALPAFAQRVDAQRWCICETRMQSMIAAVAEPSADVNWRRERAWVYRACNP